MNRSFTLPRALAAALLPAVGSLLWSASAVAQRAGSGGIRMPRPEDFDDWTALLVIVLCGAVGAFAADLAADGGRLDRFKRDRSGLMLGFPAKLVVGAVAALAMLALNPPAGWWQLIGAALTAGIGGEAVLLSIVASHRARSAEKDREQAEARTRRVAALARERFETLKDVARGQGEGIAEALGARGESIERRAPASAGRAEVADLADRFGAELEAFVEGGGSIRERVSAILAGELGPRFDETLTLAQMSVDPGTRRIIAREIRLEFPGLRPPWSDADVRPDSTLDSLTDQIDQRRTS